MFVFISFSLCSFLPSCLFEAGSLVPEDALVLLMLLLTLPECWNYSFPTIPDPFSLEYCIPLCCSAPANYFYPLNKEDKVC